MTKEPATPLGCKNQSFKTTLGPQKEKCAEKFENTKKGKLQIEHEV